MDKYNYEIDVAVLLVFFNRPDVLKKTFEQIKKARPSKLLLYQDGPRKNNKTDLSLILQCREIVSQIDWKCEVFTKYQEENFGCDPSGYLAHTWAFSIVDKCIVIEDDVVANVDFFRFCKEMLDKYEFDTRVCRISGMNHLGTYSKCTDSYFFSTSGSIWGWASWSRVVNNWDPSYSFMNDERSVELLKIYCKSIDVNYKSFIKTCEWHKSQQKEFFESIFFSYRLLNSGLTIIPKNNMICNIGLTADSTHSSSNIKCLPKGIQRVFNMKTFDADFPLKHPKSVINDLYYVKLTNRIMGQGFFRRNYRRIEGKIRRLFFK